MFRKGGSANEGIMHGLVDRKGYKYGSIDKEAVRSDISNIRDLLTEFSPQPRDTSMYEMLIGGGLNLVGGGGAGEGLMANIARSYKNPSEEFFKAQQARREYDRKIGSTAAQIGVEQALAMEQIAAKNQPDTALYNVYLEQGVEQGMSGSEAQRFATYHTSIKEDLRQKVGGNRVGGIIEFDLNDEKQKRKQLPKMKKDIGKYFYDPYDGKIKQLVEQNGQLGFLEFNSVDSIDFSAVPSGIATETSTPYADEQAAIDQEKQGLLTDEDIAGIRFP